ncbi:hypothetical protein QYE76_008321 [Lolium multiflorum]|uniref:Uncharacterized protein n=1 Tax=Lolium multiflorum TaxID=4521 RepID=A0AAD8QGY3_LOLMU|nr:hypothetical protein QYE76_008321 [Lolium multiflorum]
MHPRRQLGARPPPPPRADSGPPPPPPGREPPHPNLLRLSSPGEPQAQRRRLSAPVDLEEESPDLRTRILSHTAIVHQGISLFVKPWTRLVQATKVNQRVRVHLVLEGVPPHGWDREVAEELLGSSCVVEELAPETRSRADLDLFRLSAWTDNIKLIPPVRTLVIPEPEEVEARSSALALCYREEAEVTGAIGPLLLRAAEEGGVESFAGSAVSQIVAEAAVAAAAATLAALRDVVRTGKRSCLRWIGCCRRWTTRWRATFHPPRSVPKRKAVSFCFFHQEPASWVRKVSSKELLTDTEQGSEENTVLSPSGAGGRPSAPQQAELASVCAGTALDLGTTGTVETGEDRDVAIRWEDAPDSLAGGGDPEEEGHVFNKEEYFVVSLSDHSGKEDSGSQTRPHLCSPASSETGSSLEHDRGQVSGHLAQESFLGSSLKETREITRVGDLPPSHIRPSISQTDGCMPSPNHGLGGSSAAESVRELQPDCPPHDEPVFQEAECRGGAFHTKENHKEGCGGTGGCAQPADQEGLGGGDGLLKALGITPEGLSASNEDIQSLQKLFDSPLSNKHLQVVSSIFGKVMLRDFKDDVPLQREVHAQ